MNLFLKTFNAPGKFGREQIKLEHFSLKFKDGELVLPQKYIAPCESFVTTKKKKTDKYMFPFGFAVTSKII